MNLGNNLFNARKKKGMSQEEVSEKLGGKQADDLQMGTRRNPAGHLSVKEACKSIWHDFG